MGSLDRNWAHRQRHQSLSQSSTITSLSSQQTPDSPLKSQTGNEVTLPDRLNTSLPNRSMGLDRNWTPKQRQQSLPQSSITPSQPTSESQLKFQKDIKPDKVKITSPMRGVGTLDRNWTPKQRQQSLPQSSITPSQPTSESQLKFQKDIKSDKMKITSPMRGVGTSDRNWTPTQKQQPGSQLHHQQTKKSYYLGLGW